ncbi:MAG: copper chaperone PCu(A)C [Caulobacteraceae bacterium]
MSSLRMLPVSGAILAALAFAAPAIASGRSAVRVLNAWTRPAAKGMNAAGYLTVVNDGARSDALVGASSPVARSVSLHQSAMKGTVMTMRPLADIPIPAHGRAILAPGGDHLMIEGLVRSLTAGDTVPVKLVFRRSPAERVELKVGSGPP